MTTTQHAFHETVAEQLIVRLQQGTAPWQVPWEPGQPGAVLPCNPTTGKRYKGVNALHLMSQPFDDQRWMTYRQASTLGAQVRAGEKGTTIQYWKFSEERSTTDSNGQSVTETVKLERPRVFLACVFNAGQIDGLPPATAPARPGWDPVARAEQLLQASGARLDHDAQRRAYYDAVTDRIHLPDKALFPGAAPYYATALHELGHWTGHPSRLQRDLAHPYGSEGYAREELRAEIASLILGDTLGIGHDPGQHAAYVGAWIKVLQDDPLEIFRAAADAERIQGYVLGLQQMREHEQEQERARAPAEEQGVALARLHAQQVARAPDSTDEDVSAARLARDQAERLAGQGEADRLRMALPPAQGDAEPDGEKILLHVPFKDKEDARALGARWDRQERAWCIPAGIDTVPFAQWLTVPRARQEAPVRQYLAVPFEERQAAKVAGARWDPAAKAWFAGPAARPDKLARWLPGPERAQQAPALSAQEDFAQALRALGCVVSGAHPVMDGRTHRIPVEGEKETTRSGAGFYVAHLDHHPAGYIRNNKTGVELRWKAKGYVLDAAQQARLQAELADKRQAREAELVALQERAARRVARRLATLLPVQQPTPYLQAKGITVQPGIYTDQYGSNTYIPGVDVDGHVRTLQTIRSDGSKRFARGARKEGCFHVVGGTAALARAPALVIGEGYATACSVAQSLGYATVAAFDAGNLPHVARALHRAYPGKPVIITGDNDRHLEATLGINPGKEKAREAADATGGTVVLPIFAPGERERDPRGFTDFNDLAHRSVLGQYGIAHQVNLAVDAVLAQRGSVQTERQAALAPQSPPQRQVPRSARRG